MTVANRCSSCGSPFGVADRFCGVCGADLTPNRAPVSVSPSGREPEAPRKAPAKTMFGLMPPSAEAPRPAAPASTPPVAERKARPASDAPKRTMLGLSPAELSAGGAGGSLPPPALSEPPKAMQPVVPGKLLTKDQAPEPAPKAGRSRTILGLPQVPQQESAAVQAPVEASPQIAPAQGPAPGVDLSPQSKRTILGAGIPIDSASSSVAPPPQAAAVDAPLPAQPAPLKVETRPRSFTPVTEEAGYTEDDFRPVPAAQRRGPWLLVLGLLLAALLGGLALYMATRPPAFSARVVQAEDGDALEVDVPDAPAGTKVRFAGAELPLAAGRAAFPLSADALKLGDNTLAIAIVDPSGSVASSEIKLAVEYRVRTELGALLSDPPAVQIVVDALPGSRLSIDGEFLALGTDGRAVKNYPVPAQAGARLELAPRYRIEPVSGTPVEGTLKVSLPVASMQVDRPGADVITDQTVIEVAGAVEEGAEVRIDGQAVAVRDGRFLHRASLPQAGEYVLRVTARAAGKAPRIEEVRVQRVMDLTLAAASFQADSSITYGKLMQSPVTYKGQKVAFDGRVYNVEVNAGRSVIQLLALNCPSTTRCPLWVEYPQATEATVDSWIRVLGTVAGEQQFKSKQGDVQTVPSVDAQYVLKLVR